MGYSEVATARKVLVTRVSEETLSRGNDSDSGGCRMVKFLLQRFQGLT